MEDSSQAALPIIGRESWLRGIAGLPDRRSELFADAFVSIADCISLANDRLSKALTERVNDSRSGKRLSQVSDEALFIDAWMIVHESYRFKGLFNSAPEALKLSTLNNEFDRLIAMATELRNVADHLTGKIDQLVKHGGSILGVLHWVTQSNDSKGKPLYGNIFVSGYGEGVSSNPGKRNETSRQSASPTYGIELQVGKNVVYISDLTEYMRDYFEELETKVIRFYPNSKTHGGPTINLISDEWVVKR